MQKVLISIIILLLSTSTLSLAAEKKQIKRAENYLAVLDLESVGKVDKDVVRPLTDSVRREIFKSGKYEVMDRGNMDKVLKEQAFQVTGCTSKECAVEVGQLLGVGKIVVGSVSMAGKTYLLSLSVVNIETGKVEQVEDQECKCEVDDLITLSKQVAVKLMGAAVGKSVVATTAKPEPTAVDSVQNKEQTCRQTDGRFCDHGDGTVSDKTTGLMWQQRDDGIERKWDDAIAYCKGLILAGKNDWRLPSKDELQSIVDKSRSDPAINATFFLDTKYGRQLFFPPHYRSSTTSAYYAAYAWFVNFGTGNLNDYSKSDTGYVRCVH